MTATDKLENRFICYLGEAHEGTCPTCGAIVLGEAPRIYDITSDEFRAAEQADVDRLQDGCQAFGLMRRILRKLTLQQPPGEPFDVKAHIEMLRQIDNMLPSDPADKVLR